MTVVKCSIIKHMTANTTHNQLLMNRLVIRLLWKNVTADTHSVVKKLIIKAHVKRKILSIETILSAYTHRGTRSHEHSYFTKLNLHSLKTGSKQRL